MHTVYVSYITKCITILYYVRRYKKYNEMIFVPNFISCSMTCEIHTLQTSYIFYETDKAIRNL